MDVGGMHFQDNYNNDIERVKRCVIHYATPDGKVIPFCAYNTGPNFREEIEKKFAVPIEEWRGRPALGRFFGPSLASRHRHPGACTNALLWPPRLRMCSSHANRCSSSRVRRTLPGRL